MILIFLHAALTTLPARTGSLPQLSNAIANACSKAITSTSACPDTVAQLCAEAIAVLPKNAADEEALRPQGELVFADIVDYDQRFALAEPMAHAGDSQAMQTLGLLCYSGVGGAPSADAHKSAQWHAAAAAQGNVDALAVLGGCVRRGVGARQDEELGLELIKAAAAVDSPVGLTKLGVLYDEGASGVSSDPWQACQLFERAAARGSAIGLFNHGWALVHGIGVARDVERGLAQWAAAVRTAPEDGSEEAAYALYEERRWMTEAQVAELRPGKCLLLSASLGFDEAVTELRRRKDKRELKLMFGDGRTKDRFIRNDKARA